MRRDWRKKHFLQIGRWQVSWAKEYLLTVFSWVVGKMSRSQHKWKWNHSVVSNSLWPHGLEPTRLVRPWNFQARVLEWVAISFSRGSSWPRDRTQVSHIAGRHFTLWITWQVYSKDLTGFNHYTIQVILITHYSLKVVSSKAVAAVEMVGWVYFQQKRGNKDPNCPGLPLTSKVIL